MQLVWEHIQARIPAKVNPWRQKNMTQRRQSPFLTISELETCLSALLEDFV